MIIDFTEVAKNNPSFRAYGGANGVKKGILFNGKPYMLKIEHRGKKIKSINIAYYQNIFHQKYILC